MSRDLVSAASRNKLWDLPLFVAIKGYVESLKKDGEPIPASS